MVWRKMKNKKMFFIFSEMFALTILTHAALRVTTLFLCFEQGQIK